MTVEWKGATTESVLPDWEIKIRHRLADAAREYDWPTVLQIVGQRQDYVNTWRPGGKSWYTPLHQAAHGGAPPEVVQKLIDLGAWRTLPTAEGEQPQDIANRRGQLQLLSVLSPVFQHQVPVHTLAAIQNNFHAVILGRAEELVGQHQLRLPELGPLLELAEPKMWFPIPGMYGGFAYWLEVEGEAAALLSESWSRVVGGSGQRHKIIAESSQLVEEGFV